MQWRVIFFAFKALFRGIARGIYATGLAAGKELSWFEKHSTRESRDLVKDPAADKDLVKMWMWLPGLIVVILSVCVVMGNQYDSTTTVGMSLLSVTLAFFFSFLAVQCTGVTGTPASKPSSA